MCAIARNMNVGHSLSAFAYFKCPKIRLSQSTFYSKFSNNAMYFTLGASNNRKAKTYRSPFGS